MSVVRMRMSNLLQMNYVDYAEMHIKCEKCKRKYVRHDDLGGGKYWAYHTERSRCDGILAYSTEDILYWKSEEDQYDDLVKSLQDTHDQPIARVYKGWIVDGGHRLAVALLRLRLKTVLVETSMPGCAEDSGKWHYGQPIDIETVREDE
jgi:hypothetical protein